MACNQERFLQCQRNNLCHLCDGERLFKPPKQFNKPLKKKKKEGMDFEKRVVKTYNKNVGKRTGTNINRDDNARRRPNSGAIWSLPGDIVTRDALFEAKERGTRTSGGEKTISIHREWMEKVRDEAKDCGKSYWFLPFAFKDDKEIYLVTDFAIELQMINVLHDQEKMIKEQQDKINELEEKLKSMGGS